MKKILALVLAAVLALSLLPMAAAEEGGWEPFAENVSITFSGVYPLTAPTMTPLTKYFCRKG